MGPFVYTICMVVLNCFSLTVTVYVTVLGNQQYNHFLINKFTFIFAQYGVSSMLSFAEIQKLKCPTVLLELFLRKIHLSNVHNLCEALIVKYHKAIHSTEQKYYFSSDSHLSNGNSYSSYRQ